MCKFGYHVGCDGQCYKAGEGGEADPVSLAGNYSAAEAEEIAALEQESTRLVTLNVFVFVAWIAGAAAMARVVGTDRKN